MDATHCYLTSPSPPVFSPGPKTKPLTRNSVPSPPASKACKSTFLYIIRVFEVLGAALDVLGRRLTELRDTLKSTLQKFLRKTDPMRPLVNLSVLLMGFGFAGSNANEQVVTAEAHFQANRVTVKDVFSTKKAIIDVNFHVVSGDKTASGGNVL
ncbi:hypothetical protein DXG01_007226 [Tephrocybe rancida]|nr:hypothetical protein DXG01_007226 [Tephrocybe rancida]